MYAKINGGTVVKFPYTLGLSLRKSPNVYGNFTTVPPLILAYMLCSPVLCFVLRYCVKDKGTT